MVVYYTHRLRCKKKKVFKSLSVNMALKAAYENAVLNGFDSNKACHATGHVSFPPLSQL